MSAEVPTLSKLTNSYVARWTAKLLWFLLHFTFWDLRCTTFFRRSFFLFVRIVALAWFNQRDVHTFIREDRTFARVFRGRSFQPVRIIAIRKLRFVVRAA